MPIHATATARQRAADPALSSITNSPQAVRGAVGREAVGGLGGRNCGATEALGTAIGPPLAPGPRNASKPAAATMVTGDHPSANDKTDIKEDKDKVSVWGRG